MDLPYTCEQPPLDKTKPCEKVSVQDKRVHVMQDGYCYVSPAFASTWLANAEAESFILVEM
jgi:hypothetical protein